MTYDVLLTGGHVIDPKNGIDALANVAIKDGKIAAVGADVHGEATKTLDVTGHYVTCLLYTSPSPRDKRQSRMPSSA